MGLGLCTLYTVLCCHGVFEISSVGGCLPHENAFKREKLARSQRAVVVQVKIEGMIH